jgi:hypothetical protein
MEATGLLFPSGRTQNGAHLLVLDTTKLPPQ